MIPVAMYVLHTVDGEDVALTLSEFRDDNESLDLDEVAAIGALSVGETYRSGGGASPSWSIDRIDDYCGRGTSAYERAELAVGES